MPKFPSTQLALRCTTVLSITEHEVTLELIHAS
jgi:hypothetical protein